MSSTPPAPPPSGPPPSGPPPSEAAPLTADERDALERLATAELRTDPRFVHDLAAGRVRDPHGRAPRWVAVVGAVLAAGVLVGFALGPWIPLGTVLALMLAVPLGLATWAVRQDRSRP